VLAKGNLADEIKNLKQQSRSPSGGKDIIVYGGASFVSSLIKENLIDEYHFFVNPALLPDGMPIFNSLEEKLTLQLNHSIGFECGIVVLCYTPEKN
jgi:dihydrofolate reductase